MAEGSEELATSRYASLRRTPDGYAVQRHGRATVETYASTDEGFDGAWDRYDDITRLGKTGRALSALAVVGVVAAALWFTVTLLSAVVYVEAFNSRSNDPIDKVASWIAPFSTALFALFAGAVGLYGTVWLYRRGMPAPKPRR